MHQPLRSHLIIGLLLVASALIPYTQVARHEFLDWDDREYIVDNPYINQGLTARGLAWAFDFRNPDRSYWRPLTWVTHMLDFQLFGAAPGPPHLVNVGLHALNALLLYATIGLLTGTIGAAAMASFMFAVHPVNVESVAWLTERSNLLGTLFGLATLMAYVGYARRPDTDRYLAVLLTFLLCLLAKPILVTLPCLLLLLDLWPLGRLRIPGLAVGDERLATAPGRGGPDDAPPVGGGKRLLFEKLPLLFMAGAAIYASVLRLGYTAPMVQVPWSLRLENALVAYVRYLAHLVWPSGLAAFYPFPQAVPTWRWLGALALLGGLSVLAIAHISRRPWLFVGWFWFAGTLFPKSGLIQAGLWPALADRWVYFPAIGLFLAFSWGLSRAIPRWGKAVRSAGVVLGIAAGAVLMAATWVQVGFWKDSRTLFQHMLALYPDNFMGQNNLGLVLRREGRLEEAAAHFARAIAINPGFEIAYLNLGRVAAERGEPAEALKRYRQALAVRPDYLGAHLAIAGLHMRQGAFEEAARHYAQAIQIDPGSAAAVNGLGGALAKMNRLEQARQLFEQALRLDPGFVPAQKNLAAVQAALNQRANP